MSHPPKSADLAESLELELYERLGIGGMGEVYRAKRKGPEGFERWVAVKKIRPEHLHQADFRERFIREAVLTAKLRHPNIAQVHELHLDGPEPRMILDLIEGVTLKSLILNHRSADRTIPLAACLRIGEQILSALEYAHRFQDPESGQLIAVVHRDLTPTNVMLDRGGLVKILDFGIAKPKNDSTPDQTQTLHPLGNPSYPTPETVQGKAASPQTDLFQFGLVLYELLTLERPFNAPTARLREDQVLSGEHISAKELRHDVPDALGIVIERCLASSPDHRYQSAAEVLNALRAIPHSSSPTDADLSQLIDSLDSLGSEVAHTRPDRNIRARSNHIFRKKRRPAWLLIAGALTALVLTGTHVAGMRKSVPHPIPPIYWDNSGKIVQLNPEPLKYAEAATLAPNILSKEACHSACLQGWASISIFLDPGMAAQIDAKGAGATFQRAMTLHSDSKSSFNVMIERCGYIPYCLAVKNLSRYFDKGTSKITIAEQDSASDIRAKLLRAEPRLGRLAATASLAWSKELSTNLELHENRFASISRYPMNAILARELVTLPEALSLISTGVCVEIGDFLYAKDLGSAILHGTPWNSDFELLLLPHGTGTQVRGAKDGAPVLGFLEGANSSVFSMGICAYGRAADGKLRYARHWIPKP